MREGLSIEVTIGTLDPPLKNLDKYGEYLRGWNAITGKTSEPDEQNGLENVLVRRLEAGPDLEAHLSLVSRDPNNADGDLRWEDRERLAPMRLGTYSAQQLAFGPRSVLTRKAGRNFCGAAALAEAARAARETFGGEVHEALDEILGVAQECAQQMNVPAQGIQALLDAHAATVTQSGVALHDADQIPLRGLGAGSSRLLVAALQQRLGPGLITLADEVEHALEPYRVVRLLRALGSKDQNRPPQSFLTTHSPVVLRELEARQLWLMREMDSADHESHRVTSLGDDEATQKAVRACAEAFLSPRVMVCEGKTEIGFVRGLDLYNTEECHQPSMASRGVDLADGTGSSLTERAKVFAGLGYRTALFLDNDDPTQDAGVAECEQAGVTVVRWHDGKSIDQKIFENSPPVLIPRLLEIAINHCGEDSVRAHIKNADANLTLDACLQAPAAEMREPLGRAAKKGDWFKDISTAERVAREVIASNLEQFEAPMKERVAAIRDWIRASEEGR
ncbi:MAG: ATP-dependent nuclease [Terriglobales bacterium]